MLWVRRIWQPGRLPARHVTETAPDVMERNLERFRMPAALPCCRLEIGYPWRANLRRSASQKQGGLRRDELPVTDDQFSSIGASLHTTDGIFDMG